MTRKILIAALMLAVLAALGAVRVRPGGVRTPADGELTTSGTECVMLDASSINCATTTGCVTDANVAGTNFDYTVADFDGTTEEDGAWSFELPENLTGTTFTYQYTWTNTACTADTNDDVCFEVSAVGRANSQDWHGSVLGTAIGTMDTCGTNNEIYKSDASAAVTHGFMAGERGIVVINRDTNASSACAGDNISNDVRLLALRVCYEVDHVFSGE